MKNADVLRKGHRATLMLLEGDFLGALEFNWLTFFEISASPVYWGLFCMMPFFLNGLRSIKSTLGVNGFELSLPLAMVAQFQVNTSL